MQRHEEMESLAAGYVLSALEPDEARAFAEHAASCPECAELVAELRAIAQTLPLTVPQVDPPATLRFRLLDAVRREAPAVSAQEPTGEPLLPPWEKARTRKSLLPWWEKARMRGKRSSAANALGSSQGRPPFRSAWGRLLEHPVAIAAAGAVLVIALAGTGAWAFALQDDLERSERRVASLYDAMSVLAEADQRWEFSGASVGPDAHGMLAYSGEHRAAMLIVWGLPEESETESYNAWTTTNGDRQGVGAMRRANGGHWVLIEGNVASYDGVGITFRDSEAPPGQESRVVVEVSLAAPQ